MQKKLVTELLGENSKLTNDAFASGDQKKINWKKMPLQKRSRRTGIVRWPILENDLLEWIKEERKKELPVSTT